MSDRAWYYDDFDLFYQLYYLCFFFCFSFSSTFLVPFDLLFPFPFFGPHFLLHSFLSLFSHLGAGFNRQTHGYLESELADCMIETKSSAFTDIRFSLNCSLSIPQLSTC